MKCVMHDRFSIWFNIICAAFPSIIFSILWVQWVLCIRYFSAWTEHGAAKPLEAAAHLLTCLVFACRAKRAKRSKSEGQTIKFCNHRFLRDGKIERFDECIWTRCSRNRPHFKSFQFSFSHSTTFTTHSHSIDAHGLPLDTFGLAITLKLIGF